MPYNTDTRGLQEVQTALLQYGRWSATGEPVKVFVDIIGPTNYTTVLGSPPFNWTIDTSLGAPQGQLLYAYTGRTAIVNQAALSVDTSALRTITVDALRLWGCTNKCRCRSPRRLEYRM